MTFKKRNPFHLIKCCIRPKSNISHAKSIDEPMNDATEIAQEKSVEKTVNMLLTVNESKVNESKVNESKVNESQRPMKNNDTHVELKSDKEEPQKQIIQWADTVPFTFPIVGGQVIKVYDGDTITIASKLPYPESPLYRLSVRLNGIDTPEIKGSNDDEKQAAKNARDAVSSIIMQKQIRLENVQSEKYGRILADVYYGDLHLNKWLIDNRYAVAYDGGTKIAPKSWLKYKETGEK